MYSKTRSYIRTSSLDPSIYIENNGIPDYTNSELLNQLDDIQEMQLGTYLVTKYEHRIDLISEDIYGDSKYDWLILYLNRVSNTDIVRGMKLKYIQLDYLESILASL